MSAENQSFVPKTPEPESAPQILNEQGTLAFLSRKGIAPLDDWSPGQSLLYVLEEAIRGNDGPYKNIPPERRPSLARMDAPTFIDFEHPLGEGDRVVYGLENGNGAQVDYYVISAETGKPEIVQTGFSVRTKERPYHVRKDALYRGDDAVFPKGE